MMIKNRRLGKIRISVDIINNDPVGLMAVMSEMIPLTAIALPHEDCIEFIFICNRFRELSEGEAVPEYHLICHTQLGEKINGKEVPLDEPVITWDVRQI